MCKRARCPSLKRRNALARARSQTAQAQHITAQIHAANTLKPAAKLTETAAESAACVAAFGCSRLNAASRINACASRGKMHKRNILRRPIAIRETGFAVANRVPYTTESPEMQALFRMPFSIRRHIP
jgi:hypothetical protein